MKYNHICLVELFNDNKAPYLFKAYYNWGDTPENMIADDIFETYSDSMELIKTMQRNGWFLVATNSHSNPSNTLIEKYYFGKM